MSNDIWWIQVEVQLLNWWLKASCGSVSVLFNRQVKGSTQMSYRQLAREQRYQIKALMKAGHNQTQIAANVGCHKSTISRELRRNRRLKAYRPHQANELALDRQCETYRTRIAWQTW